MGHCQDLTSDILHNAKSQKWDGTSPARKVRAKMRGLAEVYGDASSSGEEDEGAQSSLPQACPTPTDRTTLPAHADASLDAPLAYAQPDGAVQLGCEVKLNDRVNDNVLGSGVIIGLPLESYESHDERRGKALVKFDDMAQPSWRTWGHLNVRVRLPSPFSSQTCLLYTSPSPRD